MTFSCLLSDSDRMTMQARAHVSALQMADLWALLDECGLIGPYLTRADVIHFVESRMRNADH